VFAGNYFRRPKYVKNTKKNIKSRKNLGKLKWFPADPPL
jgi:hypothetical protein